MSKIEIRTGDAPEAVAFLTQRLNEYNAAATGYSLPESFSAIYRNESGSIEAGTSGQIWGGCCYVCTLWVCEALRGKGIGSKLLEAVEHHAREKGCGKVFLTSHTFQAPEFYSRRGYEELARIEDNPAGHADIILAKRLNR